MRLFLLPISTRRALIFCERPHLPRTKASLVDKLTDKASATWTKWEGAESGWKKKLTSYGNSMLRRLPYEEWGLKTIPALTEKRRRLEGEGKEKVPVLFPPSFIKQEDVPQILKTLAVERQPLHRSRLIWSIIGMPITAPVALLPVIPNIPFFYLVFRAYSHWKALSGAKHLDFLVDKNLIQADPSSSLDKVYAAGLMYESREKSRDAPDPTDGETAKLAERVTETKKEGTEETMLLKKWNGKLLAERFNLPEMEVEIERAVEQVSILLKKRQEEQGQQNKEQGTEKQ